MRGFRVMYERPLAIRKILARAESRGNLPVCEARVLVDEIRRLKRQNRRLWEEVCARGADLDTQNAGEKWGGK